MLENTERSIIMPSPATPVQRSSVAHIDEKSLVPLSRGISGQVGLEAQSALHAECVLQLLQVQRHSGVLCDITVHVQDRSFKAHKALLAACSLYFRGLFENPNLGDSTALNLTSLTTNGFQILLDYIYTGKLSITADNSSEVLSAAICLQMNNVVETCLKFMRSSFQMSTKHAHLSPPLTKCTSALGAPNEAVPSHRGLHETLASKTFNSNAGSPPNNTQETFQIVSMKSIKEAEFKSMMKESKDEQSLHGQAEQHNRRMPQHLQVSSDLARLQNPHSSNVRLLSTPLACTMTGESRSANSNSHNNRSATNPSFKSTNRRISPVQHKKTTPSYSLPVRFSLKSTFENDFLKNDVLCKPSSTVYCSVASDKNFSTISSAALLSTPEQNSGIALAGSEPLDFSSKKSTLENHEQNLDEAKQCDVWRTERSVAPPDLSGTPSLANILSSASQLDASHYETPFIHMSRHASPKVHNYEDSTSKTPYVPTSSNKVPNMPHPFRTSPVGCIQSDGLVETALMYCSHPPFVNISSYDTPEGYGTSEAVRGSLQTRNNHRSSNAFNDDSTPQSAPTISYPSEKLLSNHGNYKKILDSVKVEPESFEIGTGFPVDKVSLTKQKYATHTVEGRPEPIQPQCLSKKYADAGAYENNEGALDLSRPPEGIPQRRDLSNHLASLSSLNQDSDSDAVEKQSSCFPSDTSSFSDPGIQPAADVLSVLQHSSQSQGFAERSNYRAETRPPSTQDYFYGENTSVPQTALDVSPKPSPMAFSRKPRRRMGGQTCTWPGCGRLFRHRKSYKEHQSSHELGAPVSKLRKQYTGARVKKTVREQLEELRTTDNVFDRAVDNGAHYGRTGKRKSPDFPAPVRKRVSTKDRPIVLDQERTTSIPPSKSVVLSRSAIQSTLPLQHISSTGDVAPELRFIQVIDADGVVKLVQTVEQNHSQIASAQQSNGCASSPPRQSLTMKTVPWTNTSSLVLSHLALRASGKLGFVSTSASPATTGHAGLLRRRLAIRERADANVPSLPSCSNSNILNIGQVPITETNPISARRTDSNPVVFSSLEPGLVTADLNRG